jgi:hypothetical protein
VRSRGGCVTVAASSKDGSGTAKRAEKEDAEPAFNPVRVRDGQPLQPQRDPAAGGSRGGRQCRSDALRNASSLA